MSPAPLPLQDRRAGWRAALACMVTLAVAMGLGRFAFTPLLPLMLREGQLSLPQGGALASLNYLGYCAGALSCAAITQPPARLVRVGLLGTALLLLGMGLAQGFASWGVLRTLAGVMSAWAFVFASGWGLRRLAETGMAGLGGVIYAGPGIGIVATGLLSGVAGLWGASAAWIGFGVVALVLAAVVWPALGESSAGAQAAAPGFAPAPAPSLTPGGRHAARWLIGLYGLAGFGYIITATFLPLIARQALPHSPWPERFWTLFGLAIIAGALIGARAPTHWDNRRLLAVAYALQTAGVALSILWPSAGGFALGSVLLGLPFTAITLFAMREARRLRGNASAALMGYATASYGIGQIAGPIFAAALAARAGSFTVPLLAAATALAVGALLFWRVARTSSGLASLPALP